mgnify:CR=1 FL=1
MIAISFSFFFFNDTATTEIYTRSLVGSVRCVKETDVEQHDRNVIDEPVVGAVIEVEQGDLPRLVHKEVAVSYTHLRAHETVLDLVCRLLLEKKNKHKRVKKHIYHITRTQKYLVKSHKHSIRYTR